MKSRWGGGPTSKKIPRGLGASGSEDSGSTMKDTERLSQGRVEASERAGLWSPNPGSDHASRTQGARSQS